MPMRQILFLRSFTRKIIINNLCLKFTRAQYLVNMASYYQLNQHNQLHFVSRSI